MTPVPGPRAISSSEYRGGGARWCQHFSIPEIVTYCGRGIGYGEYIAVLTGLSFIHGEPEDKTAVVFRELEWNSVVKARLGSMAGLCLGAEVGQSSYGHQNRVTLNACSSITQWPTDLGLGLHQSRSIGASFRQHLWVWHPHWFWSYKALKLGDFC